jgi:hypothetical protein
MAGRLLRGGNENVSAIIVNPDSTRSILSHLRETTRYTSNSGIMDRKNQAYTNPAQYIADKKKILKAMIEGCDGNGNDAGGANAGISALNLALPGAANTNIPEMNSLVFEWQNTYKTLVASGVPKDTAALQADANINSIYDQRATLFTAAFPDLVDNAYDTGLSYRKGELEYNSMTSGYTDAPKQYKFDKYKRRAKKYKANKRSAAPKT